MHMADAPQHGFSGKGRSIVDEDEIHLTSVGVDIGSSTSHLVFSELTLERQNTRYAITKRRVIRESDILLTPYKDDLTTIDSDALGAFIDRQYKEAGLAREQVDTGALILTGVAVRRSNARAIGELFAGEAGKFVAVSAGDGLEATMAAFGSGAAAESGRSHIDVVMNIDIGGGTSKVALCQDGKVLEVTAIDVGARLVATDEQGTVQRMEEAGRYFAGKAGLHLENGAHLSQDDKQALVSQMADKLMEVVDLADMSEEAKGLLRLPPLAYRGQVNAVIFSGGVSEFVYGREPRSFGDLGPELAAEMKQRIASKGWLLMVPAAGIRATVIGASQYTIQVSGSTIYITPDDAVPVRNIPVVVPEMDLSADELDPAEVADAVTRGLTRLDLAGGESAVAVGFRWGGSATFKRLDGFCRGVAQAMGTQLAAGQPLVLVGDGDIGGLIGLHLQEEVGLTSPIISIDGIDLREFDFIDIGAIIPSSGAAPVVIKSLVFPAAAKAQG
jgi:ethanolamine utilization protein EutA